MRQPVVVDLASLQPHGGMSPSFGGMNPSSSLLETLYTVEAARQKLRVPFYMYTDKDVDGLPTGYSFALANSNLTECGLGSGQHFMGEFMFIEALKRHPWRTNRSEDAMVIVIPVVTAGMVDVMVNEGAWLNGLKCPEYTYNMAEVLLHAVQNSSLYRRRTRDHLIVSGHDIAMAAFATLMPDVIVAAQWTYTMNERQRTLVTPFGTPSRTPDDFPANGAERPISFFQGGQMSTGFSSGKMHPGYYMREHLLSERSRLPAGTVLITTSPPPTDCNTSNTGPCSAAGLTSCGATLDEHSSIVASPHALACHGKYDASIFKRVRYSICTRGDNPSSPRLYEAAMYGAIPVFISDRAFEVANPFQCVVPYGQFTRNVEESACLANCGAALTNATASDTPSTLRMMRRLLRMYRRDLLWDHPHSRVAENILLETAHRYYPSSAPGAFCPFPNQLRTCLLKKTYLEQDPDPCTRP